jgi:hypothetical protein
MKTTFFLFLVTVSIGVARAQDEYYADDYSQDAAAAPAVVYEAPVTYAGPVVYQAPVVYYGPVFYGTPLGYALNACATCEDNAIQSTVTYIGGGQPRFQVSPQCVNNRSTVTYIGGAQTGFQVSPRCNYGSTLTFIGGSWYSSH